MCRVSNRNHKRQEAKIALEPYSKDDRNISLTYLGKLKLDSNDAECQIDSESILYVNIFVINRRARAREQKCIFRQAACVRAEAR